MGILFQAFSELMGGRKLPDDKWEAHMVEMGKDDPDIKKIYATYKARVDALREALYKARKAITKSLGDYDITPKQAANQNDQVSDLYYGQIMELTKHTRDIVDPRWHRRLAQAGKSKTAKGALAVGMAARTTANVGLTATAQAGGASMGKAVLILVGGAATPVGWAMIALTALDKIVGVCIGLAQKGQKLDYEYTGVAKRCIKYVYKSAREKSQEWKKMDAKKSLADRAQYEKTLYRVILETKEHQDKMCERANDFETEFRDEMIEASKKRMEVHNGLKKRDLEVRKAVQDGLLQDKKGKKDYDTWVKTRLKLLAKLKELEEAEAKAINEVNDLNNRVNACIPQVSNKIGAMRADLEESQAVVTA